jgi:hypothetical protein
MLFAERFGSILRIEKSGESYGNYNIKSIANGWFCFC